MKSHREKTGGGNASGNIVAKSHLSALVVTSSYISNMESTSPSSLHKLAKEDGPTTSTLGVPTMEEVTISDNLSNEGLPSPKPMLAFIRVITILSMMSNNANV